MRDLDKFEQFFMEFGRELGLFGRSLEDNSFSDDNVKMLSWQTKRKLKDLYDDIEGEIKVIREFKKQGR
jgi:hypothetical protein